MSTSHAEHSILGAVDIADRVASKSSATACLWRVLCFLCLPALSALPSLSAESNAEAAFVDLPQVPL